MTSQKTTNGGGSSGGTKHEDYCILCGDKLTNDLERDTGVCGNCSDVKRWGDNNND